jgi:putative transposase
VVFVPNRRRRHFDGELRRQLGAICHALARHKEGQILEGPVRPAHGHRCSAIPPKGAGAQGSGFWKGKSAIASARQFGGKARHFTGEPFWARGDAVSTGGFELEPIRAYLRKQDDEDPDAGGKG